MDSPKPLLIISDSISCSSGLGRIARDLATRIHENMSDVYRVATAGYGGSGSSRFPFKEYHFHSVENWLLPELPQIAQDFAGGEELILMWIWDLSRVYWVGNPQQCQMPHLNDWLSKANIKKWIYHPIDADGPQGRLSVRLADTMKHFDRVLDYSAFSSRVTGNPDHLPHGIDASVFRPYDRRESKRRFRELGFQSLQDTDFLVGVVGTNQARKDWALAVQTVRTLLDRGHDVKLWCHVDQLERFWSLPNLIADYGLAGRVVITNANFTDEQMAQFYSACDVFLSIGLGEGFGFGQYEALACGVPVVAGDYCGSEWLPPGMKVEPVAYRYEGPYCCKRPVYDPKDWADLAEDQRGIIASLPSELDWNVLWPRWRDWFRKGLNG